MTQMHFAQKQDGWFGPVRTYVRIEDVMDWLTELSEKHEKEPKQHVRRDTMILPNSTKR